MALNSDSVLVCHPIIIAVSKLLPFFFFLRSQQKFIYHSKVKQEKVEREKGPLTCSVLTSKEWKLRDSKGKAGVLL
jgi:hypothetical protein